MVDEKKINDMLSSGLNCSQVVTTYFSKKYGLSEDLALKVSKAFESGMFMSGVCGAVSGAYMVISLAYADENKENRAFLKQKINHFTEEFKKQMGSLICKDLLGADISSDDIMQEKINDKTIPRVCPNAITTAIKILDSMV